MLKIYFGRQPDEPFTPLDDLVVGFLKQTDYSLDAAVEKTLADLVGRDCQGTLWTMNPLIPNYMDDDVAAELFWIIDGEGNHIHMKEDAHMFSKLSFMGPGDALCDDYRSFNDK